MEAKAERNRRIVEAHEAGATQNGLARRFKLSRVRVRQIVEVNRIKDGIVDEVDAETFKLVMNFLRHAGVEHEPRRG